MSQHDMNIANADGASVRQDINNALIALATFFSGATEPATTWPYMPWIDTASSPKRFKLRNAADDDWIWLPLSVEDSSTAPGGLKVKGTLTLDGSTEYSFINSISTYFALKDVTHDVIRFLVNHGTGNIGINGLTNPGSPLTVAGRIESTTGGFKFPDGSEQLSAAAGGKILQVKQTTYSVAAVTTGVHVWSAINFSVQLTPASASSKFLVLADIKHSPGLLWKLGRVGDPAWSYIYEGAPAVNREQISGGQMDSDSGGGAIASDSAIVLDAPATTDPVSYVLAVKLQDGYSMAALNRSTTDSDSSSFSRSISSITVLEIAG